MIRNALVLILLLMPYHAWSQIVTLKHGELLLSASTTPPDQHIDGWQSISLPDPWSGTRYQSDSAQGWYRFNLDTPPPGELWGIYLPRLNMNAAVYFNGHYLGDGGSFDEPLGRNWSRPLYFTIPAGLWHSSENQIMIRLKSYYGFGTLGNIFIGTDSQLKPEFQNRHFWEIGVSSALFLLLLVISLFMLSMWYHRRQDSMYLFFALTTFTWSFFSLNKFIMEIPVSGKIWDGAIYSIIVWWGVFLALFCFRIARIDVPRMEKALYLFGMAATLNYMSCDVESLPLAALVWQLGIFVIGCTTLVMLIIKWNKAPSPTIAMIASAMALICAVGVYDMLTQARIIAPAPQILTHLLDLSSSLMLLIIAWHLTKRFVHALNESEALTRELETRISAKSEELEQSYRKLAELEKQQAILAERERIHRDLHDDVGAKLLSLTYRSNEENAQLARSALQDLRDVVSRTSHEGLTLGDALADWRAECDSRFEDADITLHWQQSETLPELPLKSAQTMNIGRILREAVSNIIRHSQASNATIIIEYNAERIHICIENDGVDRNIAIHETGRGIQNMKARAAALGGAIHWHNREPSGCRIDWWFPLTQAESPEEH